MLKKIKKIKNIRNILELDSDIELKKHTIIYALNGSGKTTISNLLASIKNGSVDSVELEKHKSLEAGSNSIEFELLFEENNSITHERNNPNIKEKIFVYNNHFLNKHVNSINFSENKNHEGDLVLGTISDEASKEKLLENETKDLSNEVSENKSKVLLLVGKEN